MTSINEKRLNIILLIVSAIAFFEGYWALYKLVAFQLPNLSVGVLNIVDLFAIFIFVIAITPCTFGIRKLLLIFLKNEKKEE